MLEDGPAYTWNDDEEWYEDYHAEGSTWHEDAWYEDVWYEGDDGYGHEAWTAESDAVTQQPSPQVLCHGL